MVDEDPNKAQSSGVPRRAAPGPVDWMSCDENRIYQFLSESDQPDWLMLRRNRAWSEQWVVFFLSRQRPVPREAIQDIFHNQLLRRNYAILKALLACRYTPPSLGMNLVAGVRWGDLLKILREPYLNGAVRRKIETHLVEMMNGLALGQKITIAKTAPFGLVKHLRFQPEAAVVRSLLQNFYFTYEDALFIASHQKIKSEALGELAVCAKWNQFKQIRINLLRHENTPHAVLLPLTEGLGERDLYEVLEFPHLRIYPRRLVERILEEKFQVQPGQLELQTRAAEEQEWLDLSEQDGLVDLEELSECLDLSQIWVKWD